MKYKEQGFRPLYKNFCIFKLNDVIRAALADEKGIDEADGVMVYGYVDKEAGNTLELVALTKKGEGDKYSFIKLTDESRFFVRMSSLMNEEFEFVDYGPSHLYLQFQSKIDRLTQYNPRSGVEKSRTFKFLDEFRYEKNFDDVKVVLYKPGLELEGVWAKIESLANGTIMGTLLTDPKQDFGVKIGSPIAFVVNENKDKSKTLVANLTPQKKYTSEELADGKILKEALKVFNEDKDRFKLYAVLEILKDSKIYVPYAGKSVEMLSAKHKVFYPVFSNLVEMWEYEDNITKTDMSFMEALKKAKSSKKADGIVVNPFSESVIIPRSMFSLIEGFDSDIEE